MLKEYTLFFCLLVGLSHSAPVDNSEVELIEPVNSDASEDSGHNFFGIGQTPILVIHGGYTPNFKGFELQDVFPTRGAFPFSFGNFFGPPPPRRSHNNPNDEEVEIEFLPASTSAGSFDDDKIEDDEKDANTPHKCGVFCQVFAELEKELRLINSKVNTPHKGIGGFNPFFTSVSSPDKSNTTYTEKTLPDGSVVRVNQTTYSDADKDGNAFFFHSSTHVFGGPSDESDDKDVDDEKSPEGPSKKPESDSPKVVQAIPDEDIGFKLPEDFDPLVNEVSENNNDNHNIVQRHAEEIPNDLPSYGRPIGDSDIRVNDIISNNGKQGSLIQIDPDSELIVEVDKGVVVPLDEFQGEEWGNQQREQQENTWNQQQQSSQNIYFPDH